MINRVLQPYLLNNPERIRMFGPRGAAVAAACGGAVDDRARDRDQCGQIRRAVQRRAATSRWTGKCIEEDAKPKLRLIWTEAGGPPVVAPVQRGFGSRLIERSARDQLGGEATVDFLPRGVVYTVTCALEEDGSR